MSAIIGGISQNSDLQSMIFQMFNKINNATINSGEKTSALDTTKAINVEDFARNLEKQLQVEKEIQKPNQNGLKAIKLDNPATFNITNADENSVDFYKEILNSVIESLKETEEKSDVKISKTPSVENAGSIASADMGDSLKNLAGSFIQKLIDNYKDKGSILGINV